MSRFILQIAAVVCLLIFVSGKCSATFLRPAVVGTLPPNPDDDYYQSKFFFEPIDIKNYGEGVPLTPPYTMVGVWIYMYVRGLKVLLQSKFIAKKAAEA